MTTALIPARGGSKGLPGKNLRRLCGQTLLARCIATCRAVVADVLVSTDSAEIASEARRNGARVHWRPDVLATDDATTWDVVRDALGSIGAETIVLAQCTAPLMTPADVAGCIQRLPTCDLAVCVHECHDLLVTAAGQPINWSLPPQRRQDMAPQYRISGSCWAFRKGYARGSEYGGRIGLVVSEHPLRLDIDTADDLRLAEALIAQHQPTREELAELLLTG